MDSTFYEHRVLQLFCHNVQGAHDIKWSQKQLELKFWWFQRLRSKFTRSSHRRCSIKKLFLKISQYSQENTCPIKTASLRLWHRGFPVNFFRTPLDECFCFKTVAGFTVCNYILLATFKQTLRTLYHIEMAKFFQKVATSRPFEAT